MAEAFDPYRKWLGIPLAEQPPHHYRLLGLGLFEDDPDTIEIAADRQMAHLRTFQTGPHSAVSQKLLNECAAARLCLLNRAKKAPYDAELRARLARPPNVARPVPVAMPVPMSPGIAFDFDGLAQDASHQPPRSVKRDENHSRTRIALATALLASSVAAIAAGAYFLSGGKPSTVESAIAGRGRTVGKDDPGGRTRPSLDGGQSARSKQPAAPTISGAKPSVVTKPRVHELKILAARWGKGDQQTEITSRVRELVADNRLLATARGDFFEGCADPAFGTLKNVVIRYSLGGDVLTTEVADSGLIDLDGRGLSSRPAPPGRLELVEARYVVGVKSIDCLPRIERYLHQDRLAVRVSLAAGADLAPNYRKALVVRYRGADGEHVAHAWDGESLVLFAAGPAAAGEPIDSKSRAAVASGAPGEPIDLFQHFDVRIDSVAGEWELSAEGLHTPLMENARLQIPWRPPDDYELRVVAARKSPGGALFVGLVVAGRQTALALDGWGGVSGMQVLDGNPAPWNETALKRPWFTDDKPRTIVCTVHRDGVRATCDGETVVDWHGDPQRLGREERMEVPDELGLFLSDWNGSFVISKLELTPLAPEQSAARSKE